MKIEELKETLESLCDFGYGDFDIIFKTTEGEIPIEAMIFDVKNRKYYLLDDAISKNYMSITNIKKVE